MLLISDILDLCNKSKFVQFCFKEIFIIDEVGKKFEEVKNLLICLYDYYKDFGTKIGGGESSSGVDKLSTVDSRKFDISTTDKNDCDGFHDTFFFFFLPL